MSNTNTNLQTQTSSVLQNDTVSSCSISKVQEKTQLSRIKCMKSLRAISSQLNFLQILYKILYLPIFKRTFLLKELGLLITTAYQETISQTDCKTTLTKLRTTFENAFNSEFKAQIALHPTPGMFKKSRAERTRHQRQYERRVNKRQMQTQKSKIDTGNALDADLVDTESIRTASTVQDDSNRSGNDTDADDADIRPIYDEEPMAEIFTGHGFSPNKTSAMYEKTSSRYDLRWKSMGRIFKSVGLRWIPTGKLSNSCTSKVDSEPPHGSNVDIPDIHECKQTLDVTAVVSKSSDVTTADASDKSQQPDSTSSA
ncbi:hypothetical protein Tco_0300678 [Tanacetum coccineum]